MNTWFVIISFCSALFGEPIKTHYSAQNCLQQMNNCFVREKGISVDNNLSLCEDKFLRMKGLVK